MSIARLAGESQSIVTLNQNVSGTENSMSLNRGACRPLVCLPLMMASALWIGCVGRSPLQERRVGEYGRFEFRTAESGSKGVVIGVPHGGTEPAAVEYAHSIRDHLDAGLVLVYDFASKRIPVSQPLIHTSPMSWSAADGVGRGSVYAEFRTLLRSTVDGPIEFYVGLRAPNRTNPAQRIEVASAGLSFEQLKI
jgi:hypothetical protein